MDGWKSRDKNTDNVSEEEMVIPITKHYLLRTYGDYVGRRNHI